MKYNKLILIFVSLVLVCNIVNANIIFDEIKCSKDGSLELRVYSEDSKIDVENVKVIARLKAFYDLTLSKIDVNGSWDSNYIGRDVSTFKSLEAQLKEVGEYEIILNYIEDDLSKNAVSTKKCPGLIFSCNLLNVDIKNCTNVDDKYFNLLVELAGINQSIVSQIDIFDGIDYSLIAKNNYKDIKGLDSDRGSLPEGIKVSRINDNLYLFSYEFKDNFISSVNVYMKEYEAECKNAKLYDYQECIKIYTNNIKEENISIPDKEIKQKEIPKLTGEIIKVKEIKSSNKDYLIYIIPGIIILLVLIFIIKKQKVNKYV